MLNGGPISWKSVNQKSVSLNTAESEWYTASETGKDLLYVCVFITVGPSTKMCAWGGGGYWGTCATRDDEPRPVWTRLPITH
jgi:hypothetical protein